MEPEEIQRNKPEKPRRSSILKVPKARNVFDDDEEDADEEKPARRVSFASSNFVKPFVADPEKNTIWDTTYEEEIFHTNSTQSDQTNSSAKLESTQSQSKSLTNVTQFEQTMELTTNPIFDKENIPILPEKKFSFVTYAQKLSSKKKLDVFNDDGDDFKVVPQNQSLQQTNEVSRAGQTSSQKIKTLRNVTSLNMVSDGMDFTCLASQSGQSFTKSVADMEFTCQITQGLLTSCQMVDHRLQDCAASANQVTHDLTNNKLPYQIHDSEITNQVPQLDLAKTVSDMECTCQSLQGNLTNLQDIDHRMTKLGDSVASINQISPSSTKVSDLEFTCQVTNDLTNELPCQIHDSEITKQVPQNSRLDLAKTATDMECTCQSPQGNLTNLQDIDHRMTKLGGSVASINQVSPSSTKVSDLEFTCQVTHDLTNELPCQIHDSQITKKVPQNSRLDLAKTASDMEFTCQVTQLLDRQMSNLNDGIELTCQFPQHLEEETRQISNLNFTKLSDGMELTCQLPQNSIFHSTKMTDDLEFTCQVPHNLTEVENNINCQTNVKSAKNTSQNFHEPCEKLELSEASQMSKNEGSNVCQNTENNKHTKNDFTKTNHELNLRQYNVVPHRQGADNVEVHSQSINNTAKTNSKLEVTATSLNDVHMETICLTPLNDRSSKFFTEPDNIEFRPETNMTSRQLSASPMEIDPIVVNDDRQMSERKDLTKQDVLLTENVRSIHIFPEKSEVREKQNLPINKTIMDCVTPKMSSKFSQIPLRVNSSLLNTPDLKNKSQLLKDQSFSVSLPKLTPAIDDLSLQQTKASFHMNTSSGMEDTQHFLHYSYSRAPTPSSTFLKYRKAPAHTVLNLEEEDSSDTSVHGFENNKLCKINDTYVLKGRRETVKSDSNCLDADDSLGIIPDRLLETVYDVDIKEDTKIKSLDDCENKSKIANKENEVNCVSKEDSLEVTAILERLKTGKKIRSIHDLPVKQYDIVIKKFPFEVTRKAENIRKQKQYLTNFLENFKCRPMRTPAVLTVDEISLDTFESLEELSQEIKIPTIEDNIRKHQESCQKCWKLERVDDESYHFSTLFGTLLFVIGLNSDSARVTNLETVNKLVPTSQPIAKYIMKLFLDKLNVNVIKGAIGDHFDVLSLLDYVQMIMLRLHQFQKDFMLSNMVFMEEEFIAKYPIASLPMILYFEILVDVRDIDNLNCDKDITIMSKIGTVNQSEIINLAKQCPKGLDFFTSFERAIQEYVRVKQHRKTS